VARTSPVRRVAVDRPVVRTARHAADPVRCRDSRLPFPRLRAAPGHRLSLARLGARRSDRLRLHLRAAQGSDNRSALCAVAE